MLDLVAYTDCCKGYWDSFVLSGGACNGTFLHTRRFLDYHPPERFRDSSILIQLAGRNDLVAVVPAAIVCNEGQDILFSHPGSTYGGPVIAGSFYKAKYVVPMIQLEIKRIYYIYDVPINTRRGMHAHKKLKQVLWCPYGQIDVVIDNGRGTEVHALDAPEKLLLDLEGQWREMYWRQTGSVLCVAASDFYDEEDYIRDYDEFLKLVKEGYWTNESGLQSLR